MALTETDFITIKEKMNKIDQRLDGLKDWMVYIKIGKQNTKRLSLMNNVKKFNSFMNRM